MNMTIRPLRAEERKYTYEQSSQLTAQTGTIGYLCGNLSGGGSLFLTSWYTKDAGRKTKAFVAEFDEVADALRFDKKYGPLLANRRDMLDYVRSHPESAFDGEYGFRVDTEDYVYLLRCNPMKVDFNFYCYCFERKWLDRHLQEARQGIRFITPDYKEKFRIPDGDKIRISQPNGESKDFAHSRPSCSKISINCFTWYSSSSFREWGRCMKMGGCSLEKIARKPLVFPLFDLLYDKYFKSVSASENVKSFGFDFSLFISFSFCPMIRPLSKEIITHTAFLCNCF